jgi:microcompartment protein PduB
MNEQDMMKQVMEQVMQRLAPEIKAEAPAPAASEKPTNSANFTPIGVTEYIGTAMGHTIGAVIANVEPHLHELMGIDKRFRSIGIISDRIGAGPQLMAADEAVKATNTEIVSAEMPRDTEGGCGHGCLIIFGAEDVSDAKRAVEVTLSNTDTFFGDVWGNEVGYLELQYTARASYCLNKSLGAPVGRAFGLVLGAPAGIGVVISDTALKAAEVEAFAYCSPSKGTSLTNESFIMITGDSGAVRQAIRSAREVGVKLLATLGSQPKSATTPYI